jgi:iron-sulfur cluster assembly protein
MIKITPEAASQIKLSTEQSNSASMPLRIAATKNADDTIHYGMGFDDKNDDDISIISEDIEIIVAPVSAELLKNTTLDFVEIEPGKKQFIFMNPNDPEYTPPSES